MLEEYINVKIKREDCFSEYKIPYQDGINALAAMKYIYENLDRSIAYPLCLCRIGRCGACAMKINGKPVLGCAVRLESNVEYLFEPISDEKCIKDLICK